ncbi:MAG: DUF370 domain-containing protein [Clostridia bacterium]|nr:DUF370 domain-containing protein [Clostridia bacterium]
MRLVNIGYGNMASASRIIALVSPDSAPVKRLVQDARDAGHLVDGTAGRRTRTVLVMDNGSVVLSSLLPETLSVRLQGEGGGSDTAYKRGEKDQDE